MNEHARHEESDIDVRAILGVGAGLIAAGVVIGAVVWALFVLLSNGEAQNVVTEFPMASGQTQRLPPEPRLQTDPREDLRALRQSEDNILQSYGWIDKDAGVVRIPIDQAMKVMLERGLPVRAEGGKQP
jgi:hypothetical protein